MATTTPKTPDERFGELRSMLNGASNRDAFVRIIETAEQTWQTHREEVEAKWLPYMEGSLRRWRAIDCMLPFSSLSNAREVATRPWAPLCRGLDFGAYGLSADEIEALIKDGFFDAFPWIEHLGLAKGQVRKKGIKLLGEAGALANLHSLDLSHNRLHKSTFEMLVGYLDGGPLEELTLSHCALGDGHMSALTNSSLTVSLGRLDLSGNKIKLGGVQDLARKRFGKLSHLDVSDCGLGEDAMMVLLSANFGLDSIRVTGNKMGVRGARAAREHHMFSRMVDARGTLDLRGQMIGSVGVRALAESGALAGVTKLDLHNNNVMVEGAMALADCKDAVDLVELDLGYNALLGGAGLWNILNFATMPRLRKLTARSCGVSELGALSDNLPSLRILDLSWNDLDSSVGTSLAQWEGLKRLRILKFDVERSWGAITRSIRASKLMDDDLELQDNFGHRAD